MNLEKCFSLVALAVSAALPAHASQPNSDVETIVVTGQRFGSPIDQELMLIHTIEREDIEVAAPKSVQELLNTIPGISVTSNGGAANTATVQIRGAQGDHALVLVDGVRVSSATSGGAAWGALTPDLIERIEVLKGPRASVWGSDAIAGVIQIFTRKLDAGQWYVSAEAGSASYLRQSAGVGIGHGEGSSTLSINHEESDGFDVLQAAQPDDDGYERLGLGLVGHQVLNESWGLEWKGELNSGDYDYDTAFGGADEGEYDNHLLMLGVNFQQGDFSSKLNLSTMRDKNENSLDGDPFSYSLFETRREAAGISGRYTHEALTVIAGVDWYGEEVNSTTDYSEDSRDVTGSYLLAQYQHNGLTLELAARYDDVDNIDSESTFNAGIGYRFNPQWRLSANYGSGFKAPTFNDLYYTSAFFSGNPDLESETSDNLDITLNYSDGELDAYISAYRNEVDNLIAYVADPVTFVGAMKNINEAELQGVEMGVDFALFGLQHHLGYSYLDAEDSDSGESLPGRSEHELDYGLSYQWQQLDLRADYHYQGKRYSGGTPANLDPYHKLDLSLGYQLTANWQLRLKANNLLDESEDMVTKAGYNGPEREYFLSLTYSAL